MSPRPPSLASVATFEAAARHQSFSKAADELHLTQSAVSHAIRGLEDRLGFKLFRRHGRGVLLTDEGSRFAGQIRLGISLLSEAFEPSLSPRRSNLLLTIEPSLASKVIIPLLPSFRDRHPEIELELHASSQVTGLSLRSAADVGLRYGPGGWAALSATKLSDEYLLPVGSPVLSDRFQEESDFLGSDNLLGHVEFPWRPWFQAAGIDRPEPKCRFMFDSSILLLDAARAGVGVALVRKRLARRDIHGGSLVRLSAVEYRHHYSYWMVWNPASAKIDAIQKFRDWLVEQMSAEDL